MKQHRRIAFIVVSMIFILTGIAAAKDMTIGEAADRVRAIVNKYFVQSKDAVIEGEPVEVCGLYKVVLSVNKVPQVFYTSKDSALLFFPNGYIDVAKFEQDAQKQKEQSNENPPKTEKPRVELFVMSLCPYGLKAEKEILPVIKKFGDTIDFKIKFLVNVKGNTLNEVASLHGMEEVKEDLRQAAIIRYYPDKLFAYVEKIDQKACVISCGEVKLEDYWKKTAKAAGMDVGKIESFVHSPEGLHLLKQNEADAAKYTVTASPTLVINGVKSSSIQRGAGALEEVICSAFTKAPGMCKRNNP